MTVIPRYNFAQAFGLMWLSPFILLLFLAIEDDFHATGVILATGTFLLLLLLGFYYRAKMVKYAVGFCIILLMISSINNITNALEKGVDDIHGLLYSLSVFLFLIGVLLLTFNKSTNIEFNRKKKEAIDYANAFSEYDSQSGLSTINPLYLFAIMILAPAIQFSNYFFENGFTHVDIEGVVVLGFIFGFVGCSIGLCLKQKWSRPLFVMLLGGLFVYLLYNLFIQQNDEFMIDTLQVMALNLSPLFISLALSIYHPIIDYYFERKNEISPDYDEILDVE